METNPFTVLNLSDDYKHTVYDDIRSHYSKLKENGIDCEAWMQDAFLYASRVFSYDLMSIPYRLYWNYYSNTDVIKTINQVFEEQLDRLAFTSPDTILYYSKSIGIIEFCLDILDYDEHSFDDNSIELAFRVFSIPWGCWEGDGYGVIKKAISLIYSSYSIENYERIKHYFPHNCEHINYALEVTNTFTWLEKFLAENTE